MRERGKKPAPAKGAGGELMKVIEQISREKGMDIEILVSALEDAITTASRKHQERSLGPPPRPGDEPDRPLRGQENLISRLNRQTGAVEVSARMRVVERVDDPAIDPAAQLGGFVDLPRSTQGLGRIEAQAAKQVIAQKVREAEREVVYNEYAGKVGEIVHGTVKRFERGDIVLDLGRAEAILSRRAQSRPEIFSQGDRVRALIVEVNKNTKGPQVAVSRTEPLLLLKLFEMEVPEIYDGTVTLKQAVREPGERAKVAVTSRDRDVDAIGACVGVKGARVQAIIRELRGEKIDIVNWSEDILTFTQNALSPAKVSRVTPVADGEGGLAVIADEHQLSLAIGKRGQNVRLAARLVGKRIDLKSEDALAAGAAGVLPSASALPAEASSKSADSAGGA